MSEGHTGQHFEIDFSSVRVHSPYAPRHSISSCAKVGVVQCNRDEWPPLYKASYEIPVVQIRDIRTELDHGTDILASQDGSVSECVGVEGLHYTIQHTQIPI